MYHTDGAASCHETVLWESPAICLDKVLTQSPKACGLELCPGLGPCASCSGHHSMAKGAPQLRFSLCCESVTRVLTLLRCPQPRSPVLLPCAHLAQVETLSAADVGNCCLITFAGAGCEQPASVSEHRRRNVFTPPAAGAETAPPSPGLSTCVERGQSQDVGQGETDGGSGSRGLCWVTRGMDLGGRDVGLGAFGERAGKGPCVSADPGVHRLLLGGCSWAPITACSSCIPHVSAPLLQELVTTHTSSNTGGCLEELCEPLWVGGTKGGRGEAGGREESQAVPQQMASRRQRGVAHGWESGLPGSIPGSLWDSG